MMRYGLFVTSVFVVWVSLAGVALAQDNVITNNAGGSDGWNTAGNWTLGHVPTNAETAVVNSSITASITTSPPGFTGDLILRDGGRISLRAAAAASVFPPQPAKLTMQEGAGIHIESGASVTLNCDVDLLGDVSWTHGGNGSHHRTHHVYGVVSGSGKLRYQASNNNKLNLYATNTFAGGVELRGGNADLLLRANGAMGAGDLVVSNGASVQVSSGVSNTIDDAASVFFWGAGSSKSPHFGKKIAMYSSETVSNFWVEGLQKVAGTWGATGSGCQYTNDALFMGSGVLNVLGSPPVVAPTLSASNIVDDAIMYTVYEDYTQVVYTLTFSLEMDLATFQASDFTNAGTASISIGAMTKDVVDGAVFYIPVAPTSDGSLRFGVAAGADLQTLVGGALDTTSAIIDDETITILAGLQPLTTISGTAAGPGGSDDTWNNAANWDFGIPYAAAGGAIETNVTAKIKTAFRTFTGDLVFREGSTLRTYGSYSVPSVFPGTAQFHDNTRVIKSNPHGSSVTFNCPVELLGSLRVEAPAHHGGVPFNYPISGSGGITMVGANNTTFSFNTTNTFSGGVLIYNGNSRIDANSDGALGMGDVIISNNCSLRIAASVSNAIADTASLLLYGPRDAKLPASTMKVDLGSDEAVSRLFIEGEPQQDGTWGPEGSSATHQTNLFSGAGILTVEYTEIPPAGSLLIVR